MIGVADGGHANEPSGESFSCQLARAPRPMVAGSTVATGARDCSLAHGARVRYSASNRSPAAGGSRNVIMRGSPVVPVV